MGCRVPEECPEEVDAIINACRQLDANLRPTALEVCAVIERSAPQRADSMGSSLHDGAWGCLLCWAPDVHPLHASTDALRLT